jgi:hypothetical protein
VNSISFNVGFAPEQKSRQLERDCGRIASSASCAVKPIPIKVGQQRGPQLIVEFPIMRN